MQKIQSTTSSIDLYFLLSTAICLILGSLGIYIEFFIFLGMLNAFAAIRYKVIKTGKVEAPKNYYFYLLFLVVLLIHTWLTKGDFMFFWRFFSGGLLWLEVYNFRNLFSRYFTQILIILGVLMALVYFYSLAFPINIPNLSSLFSPSTYQTKHSNIGDLWAVVMVSIFFIISQKKSCLSFLLFVLGGYFLFVSDSRSAVLALTVGIVYIFKKSRNREKIKKIFTIFLISAACLFIYTSAFKTVLFSRPYFLSAITGITEFPFGTGLGNFRLLLAGSNYVHNLVLEIFSGMGVFSVIFIIWLFTILKYIFTKREINVEATAVFLAILTDFCFMTTYVIPAFILLWFMSLALI